MTRPEGVEDPRNPDAPIRYDDKKEDQQRGSITLQEILADEDIYAWAKLEIEFEPLELPEIETERLEYLRRRRDEILAKLREGGGISDGE
jgi:hypothetical protein